MDISARTWRLSKYTYKLLTDHYHPDTRSIEKHENYDQSLISKWRVCYYTEFSAKTGYIHIDICMLLCKTQYMVILYCYTMYNERIFQ